MRMIKVGYVKIYQSLALGLLLFAIAPWAHSNAPSHRIAEFCDSCTTAAAAQQKAWFLAPPVHCDWPGGVAEFPIPPDVNCRSTDREVLLINPYTHAIYSYRLVFDPASNSHVLQEWALPPNLSGAASVILDIHNALIGFEFSQQVQGNEFRTLRSFALTGEGDCPQGTALDHVLNPGMRQWMIDQMHSNWMEVMQAFQQREPGVSRTIGISASFGAVRLTVGWGSGGAPIDQAFRGGFVFDNSEVSTSPPHQDMLVFDVHEFFQLGTNVSMNIEFNEGLSRAAGHPVNILFSGQAVIDKPCVLQKLDEYQQSRPDLEFRVGGPGGPLFEFPSDPDPFAEHCVTHLCARVCVDGVCGSCQFTATVLVPCFQTSSGPPALLGVKARKPIALLHELMSTGLL